jgi:glycosyltransferase involved in cell wall biosynthesis
MSTYNGERYLPVQLDSILSQQGVDLDLFVRDDGSSDGTVPLLEEYERRGELCLFRGDNVGVTRSFLDLVERVHDRYDYISFSDQDDRWHSDKLSRALSILESRDSNVPTLYCAEFIFCGPDLEPEEPYLQDMSKLSFNYFLYEGSVAGNTVVINQALANRIASAGSDGVCAHDWWMSMVALAIGELTYDDFFALDYRRTGNNVSPSGASGLDLFAKRIKMFFRTGKLSEVTAQIARLREVCGAEMSSDKLGLVNRMLDGNRFVKLCTPVRLRKKVLEEIGLRLLFLVGKL